ncbi:MAG: flippase-like domain-containing protein [Deltaproteobacteria bacterium]|nr:flippase-like domain-containing protein [Deltaproteobacteria bacterium]
MSKVAVRLLLSLAVGAGLAYFAFRGLNWSALGEAFADADYWWLVPYFGTLAGVQFFRAWRWRFLLEPIAPKMPSTWRILTVSWVGFMAIIALPLRLGEVVRPYLIADPKDGDRRDAASRDADSKDGRSGARGGAGRLRMSAAMGTIAVERVVDGLIVSLFLFGTFVVLERQGRGTDWMMATGWSALALFGGATVFLVLAMWRPEAAVRWALRLSLLELLAGTGRRRLVWFRDRMSYVLEGIIKGFRALGRPGLLVRYVAASIVYWGLNGLGFYVLARAFHLHLPIAGAFAVCGLVVIGITLPAGPGLVGNFHEFGRLGLSLFLPAVVVTGPGMAYVVLVHGVQLLWYVGIGVLVVATGQVSFRKVVEAAEADEETVMADQEA